MRIAVYVVEYQMRKRGMCMTAAAMGKAAVLVGPKEGMHRYKKNYILELQEKWRLHHYAVKSEGVSVKPWQHGLL